MTRVFERGYTRIKGRISILSSIRVYPRSKTRVIRVPFFGQLHPLVAPQVSHLQQAPLRTSVSAPHSEHGSPS
jgi:hypothetical protein